MDFQILSHAGLRITRSGTTLVIDPWLSGSCYWRSWWNYPPVAPRLFESLDPDYVYLTHVHWDHFHGPSLRRFKKTTRFLVPKGNYERIKRDLTSLGFASVRELRHGERVCIAPGFTLTSYQFGIFLDSAVVIECDDVTLFNANDAKLMGLPLRQILNRHPKIDFVFRSHSSANSRLCYQIIDAPDHQLDDMTRYVRDFAHFCQATKATHAIPFASNHCYLHDDVYHFNNTVQTPHVVADFFEKDGIAMPVLQVMVSGDSWSSESGFHLAAHTFFTERERHLAEYRAEKRQALDKFAAMESKASVTLRDMEQYFRRLFPAIPFIVRLLFRHHPVTYVLRAGTREYVYRVDFCSKSVQQADSYNDERDPIQIHTTAFIMRQCLKVNLFSHLPISKRVMYRVTTRTMKHVKLLNLILNLYEYDWLPARRIFRLRVVETYLLRWRELILYAQLLRDLLLKRQLRAGRYLRGVKFDRGA